MWDVCSGGFLVVALLSLVATGASIRAALALAVQVRSPISPAGGDLAHAVVLAPVRGEDPHLAENLDGLLTQAYPSYRVVFAVDSWEDPAVPVLRAAIGRHSVPGTIVLAPGPQGAGSGKSAALAHAAGTLTDEDRLVVTFDSDSRPHRRWLASLVAVLGGPGSGVGVASTYRWYTARGGLWSALRSAWNASGFTILFDDRYNFAWGGSLVMRREDFDSFRIREQWPASLSDDLVVTLAVKRRGLRVGFVPRAICMTDEPCDRAACVEWTTRQSGMVHAYSPRITSFALAAYGIFNGILAMGFVGLALTVIRGPEFLLGSAILLSEMPVTILTAEIRRRAIAGILPEWRDQMDDGRASFLAASLIVPWLMLVNLAKVRRLREISWRGRTYAMPSPLSESAEPIAPPVPPARP